MMGPVILATGRALMVVDTVLDVTKMVQLVMNILVISIKTEYMEMVVLLFL